MSVGAILADAASNLVPLIPGKRTPEIKTKKCGGASVKRHRGFPFNAFRLWCCSAPADDLSLISNSPHITQKRW